MSNTGHQRRLHGERHAAPLRFHPAAIWSKTPTGSRRTDPWRVFGGPRALAFHAQTHRHPYHPDHRRGAHRHRPGLRVRLFRRPGLQGAERRRLSGGAGQFEPRHHHDRSGHGGRHLYRADHAGIRREDHRERAARTRSLPDHGRADRAQHRARAAQIGRAGEVRRRADRRHAPTPSTRPRTASCSARR